MANPSPKVEALQEEEDSTKQPLIAAVSDSKDESNRQARSPSAASSIFQSSYRSQKDALRHRILHLSELLRVERTNRDDNTSCYVELVSKADREKAPSIRQAFERINQRSSANIAHLEQRLQDCGAQLKKLEHRVLTAQESSSNATSPQPQPQLLLPPPPHQHFLPRSSFSRMSPFHLPRMRNADSAPAEETPLPSLSESKENCPAPEPAPKQLLEEESKRKVEELKAQLGELREEQKVLEDEWHKLDEAWKADKQEMLGILQEEKKRHYNLEVQVNDVIQINLNEITNLKHDLACTEEKMIYQSYERARDIWEVLESYQTRLAKMEMHQQAQQQEATEHPRASLYKLYGQLMNLLLTVAAILLVSLSAVSACVLPFLRTRRHAITSLFVIMLIIAAWNYVPQAIPLEWKVWLPTAE